MSDNAVVFSSDDGITQDINLRLTSSQLEIAIKAMMATEDKVSTFVWGPPGIAKSATARRVANNLGIAYIDIRLSQIDSTDLRGMPFSRDDNGIEGMAWSPPLVLPRDIDVEHVIALEAIETIIRFHNPVSDNGIHFCQSPEIEVQALSPNHTAEIVSSKLDRFIAVIRDNETGLPVEGKMQYRVKAAVSALISLDEFNSAEQATQAAAYQLVLEHRLGEYIVPEGAYILALGNREIDKGIAFRMPTTLLNRYVHVEMLVSANEWLQWAKENNLHPHVIGYISSLPQNLFVFDPTKVVRGFPTPRTWSMVSQILKANENKIPDFILKALIVGAVGPMVGSDFATHRELIADMPSPERILDGTIKKLPSPDGKKRPMALYYMITISLCHILKEEAMILERKSGSLREARKTKEYQAWLDRADNFLAFIMAGLPPEISTVAAKTAMGGYGLPFDTARMKYFSQFTTKFIDVLFPS